MTTWNEFEIPTTEQWVEKARKSVKDPKDLEKLIWNTPDAFALNSLYRKKDVAELTDMAPRFSHRNWDVRQLIYIDKIMAANQSALKALETGADSLLFRGNFAPSEREMDALFKGIRLDWFSSYYDFGETGTSMVYILIDYFQQQGYDTSAMTGGIYIDPLSAAYLQGNFDHNEEETFRLLKTILDTGMDQLPKFDLLHVNTYYLREAGAAASLELATGLAQLTEYIHQLTERGLSVKDIASRISWNSGIGGDYFIEIAKFRALHSLLERWASGYDEEGIVPSVHAINLQRNKTVFDAHNNMLRATSEAMAAAIGGAGSITLLPFDEVSSLPDEFSYRMTRNLQLILKDEAFMDKTADPSAGSYYIEMITHKLEEAAWSLFLEIEKQGGFIAALKNKFIQQQLEVVANREKEDFNAVKKVLIGANKYANTKEVKSGSLSEKGQLFAMKEKMDIVPVRPERLSEKLEVERLKLETEKAEKEN